jgi:hypothetical protein
VIHVDTLYLNVVNIPRKRRMDVYGTLEALLLTPEDGTESFTITEWIGSIYGADFHAPYPEGLTNKLNILNQVEDP